MRGNIVLGLIMSMALVIAATAANALTIDVNVFAILDSNFDPKGTIDPSGDEATANLVAGDIIWIEIIIANPTADLVTDVFGTIIFQGNELAFQAPGGFGGTSIAEILIDQPVGSPPPPATSLERIAQPGIQFPGTPYLEGQAGPVFLRAVAFAGTGTFGTGPDRASQLFFTVLAGAAGKTQFNFDFVQTAGHFIGTTGTVFINNAVVNVPEPGTALLMGLGLTGLTAVGRRRNQTF